MARVDEFKTIAAATKTTVATAVQEMERSQRMKRVIFPSCLLEEPLRAEVGGGPLSSARSGSLVNSRCCKC